MRSVEESLNPTSSRIAIGIKVTTDDRCLDPDAFKQPSNRTVASQVTVWTTATSGPLQGAMIGNALDKGAGYGPYFDHFGFSFGMEVVPGTGALIRNGAIAPGRYGIY